MERCLLFCVISHLTGVISGIQTHVAEVTHELCTVVPAF